MITGTLRGQVDKLWEQFWTGGITNPLTVIEQISFLIFARLLDMRETRDERVFNRKYRGQDFPGRLFGPETQHLRWKNLKHEGDAARLLAVVRDELFPHMRTLAPTAGVFDTFLKDAQLLISKPSLLYAAVKMIDDFPLDQGDMKGDLYEHLLSKLTTAGINGQFRTPRHIIALMVAMVDPKPTEVVADPATGTAGFLVQTMQYLLQKYSSEAGQFPALDDEGLPRLDKDEKPIIDYTGDLLEPHRHHIQHEMFSGFDFDNTMLHIATMNLMLHDVSSPRIHYQDTLSRSFRENRPELAENHFDVILANPPFTGSLDLNDIDPTLSGKVKTKKTELLFVALIHRMLKDPGGRAAVILPDGVLFGRSKAHIALRKLLVEECELQGVVSMPSGVFKPYAGVSTAIMVFVKGSDTQHVWFYDMHADGFSLDDKRTPQPETSDLADILARWQDRDAELTRARTDQSFCVPKADITDNDYDLSISRYKEVVYEAVDYDPPQVILERLEELEAEIAKGRKELEGLLR